MDKTTFFAAYTRATDSPNHFLLRLQLPLQAGLFANVGEDHGLAVFIQAKAQRGAQDHAQFLQESGAGAKKLLWRQQDD